MSHTRVDDGKWQKAVDAEIKKSKSLILDKHKQTNGCLFYLLSKIPPSVNRVRQIFIDEYLRAGHPEQAPAPIPEVSELFSDDESLSEQTPEAKELPNDDLIRKTFDMVVAAMSVFMEPAPSLNFNITLQPCPPGCTKHGKCRLSNTVRTKKAVLI